MRLGGPSGAQAGLRKIGDSTTSTERTEPDLNPATPGDVCDTGTPGDMAADVRRVALGGSLTDSRRGQLTGWLLANTTGAPSSGRPRRPVGGAATGRATADYGTRDDIAILWPPHGAPVVAAVLTDRDTKDADRGDALIADATGEALAVLRWRGAARSVGGRRAHRRCAARKRTAPTTAASPSIPDHTVGVDAEEW